MSEIVDKKEELRLDAIRKYQILDTPPDGNFDRLVSLAAKIFNMPICIISLVDSDRIWFKSHHGLDVNQIGKAPGLCASAILSDEVYIVENAIDDPRTLSNPLVTTDFGLRFYAAAPLKTLDGFNLGTFCVIDKKQRYITEAQKAILQEFASIAMDEIEVRLAARKAALRMQDILTDTKQDLQNFVTIAEKMPKITQEQDFRDCIAASKNSLQKVTNYLEEISIN